MKRFALLTLLLASMIDTAALAASDTVNISVRGTLTRPPCVLASSSTLTVDFGDVRTDQVASAAPIAVPVTLTCPAGSSLSVGLSSSNNTFTDTVARTTANNLGVSLTWTSNNTAANLANVKRALTGQSGTVDLSLSARLVQRGELTPGSFTSTLVMNIEYL